MRRKFYLLIFIIGDIIFMRPQTKKRLKLLVVVTIVVVVILLAIFYQPFYRFLNRIYQGLMKIPKVVIIIVTLLSLFGLGKFLNPQTLMETIGLKMPQETSVPDLAQVFSASSVPSVPSVLFSSEKHKRNVTEATKKLVAAKQGWKCGLCHQTLDETYEVDHITPLYLGGSNEPSNLMALDPICHRKKTRSDETRR